jgi:hypothetical protein
MLKKHVVVAKVFNERFKMVEYIFCRNCGKVVDEYEDCCFYCGKKKLEENKQESKK